MTITHNSMHVAEIRLDLITATSALGGYLLRFTISLQLQAWPQGESVTFEVERAKVSAGTVQLEPRHIGTALPERSVTYSTHTRSSSHQLVLELELSPSQLNAIEAIRNGDDLVFTLRVIGKTQLEQIPVAVEDQLRVPVNQKTWIALLRDMGAADFLLFEVPLPSTTAPANMHAAVQMILKARDHFLRGDYEEAVGTCRKALEGLAKGRGEEDAEKAALKLFRSREREDVEAFTGMSKQDRHFLIRQAVRHFTHPAHHASSGKNVVVGERMLRSDATLILSTTASIVAHVLQDAYSADRDR